MANHPVSHQVYIRTGVVRRSANCPTHDKQTSDFLGPQWVENRTLWRFKCREKGGHDFFALPDKSAPKSAEQAAEWQKKWERELAGLTDAYDEGGRNG